MTFIRHDLNKHFVMAIKSNRTVAVSEEDKRQGRFTRINSLQWSSQKSECVTSASKKLEFLMSGRSRT